MLSASPGQPKGEKKHHDTIRDMIATSSHLLSSISHGGTQWVYGGRLFGISARTNKRHHHEFIVCPSRTSEREEKGDCVKEER